MSLCHLSETTALQTGTRPAPSHIRPVGVPRPAVPAALDALPCHLHIQVSLVWWGGVGGCTTQAALRALRSLKQGTGYRGRWLGARPASHSLHAWAQPRLRAWPAELAAQASVLVTQGWGLKMASGQWTWQYALVSVWHRTGSGEWTGHRQQPKCLS